MKKQEIIDPIRTETDELKDALEFVINDYRFLVLTLNKVKPLPKMIMDILEDHKAMAKRWGLKIKTSE